MEESEYTYCTRKFRECVSVEELYNLIKDPDIKMKIEITKLSKKGTYIALQNAWKFYKRNLEGKRREEEREDY